MATQPPHAGWLLWGSSSAAPGVRCSRLHLAVLESLDVYFTDDDSPTEYRSFALALKDTSPGKTPGWRIAGSYTTY